MKIKIGSRGSELALWQANFIKLELEKLGHEVCIKIIKTKGDRIQDLSFDKIEGKGFFTKEIEQSLLKHEVDLAVHSHKDLETNSNLELQIAAVSKRENPSDILLIKKETVDITLPYKLKKGAIIGTSSSRRKSQLKLIRDDIKLKDIRGNIHTRIEKLHKNQFDAIILAYAGVQRLKINTDAFETIILNPKEFIPAPAQGVLALQIRNNEDKLFQILQNINHQNVKECIEVERNILQLFGGGCQIPIGIYCEKKNNKFCVWTTYAIAWNTPLKRSYFEDEDAQKVVQETVMSLKKKHLNQYS